jgi:hypothetical protein
MSHGAGPNGQFAVETASGRYVDLERPDPSTIVLEDIAHHLASTTRFAGAARRPITVAEHTLLVADRLRQKRHPATFILAGLHHDDGEAYVGELTRPMKLLLAAAGATVAEVERRMLDAIWEALDLPVGIPYEIIKEADDWALAAEAWHLLPSRGRGWVTDGLYHPDLSAPPAAARLRSEHGPSFDVLLTLWLEEHRRLSRAVEDRRSTMAAAAEAAR